MAKSQAISDWPQWNFISCKLLSWIVLYLFPLPVQLSPLSHELQYHTSDSHCIGAISSSQNTPTRNLLSARKHTDLGNCMCASVCVLKERFIYVWGTYTKPTGVTFALSKRAGRKPLLFGFLSSDLSNALQSLSLFVFLLSMSFWLLAFVWTLMLGFSQTVFTIQN